MLPCVYDAYIYDAANFVTNQRTDEQGDSRSRMHIYMYYVYTYMLLDHYACMHDVYIHMLLDHYAYVLDALMYDAYIHDP